jgi:hypothetical protein
VTLKRDWTWGGGWIGMWGMHEPSPYQPPNFQESVGEPTFSPLLEDPPEVKVFGILHLVFAGIGILGAIWSLFVAIAGNPFLKAAARGQVVSPQVKAQLAMHARTAPMTVVLAIFSLVVAGIMIAAGIKLLQRRQDGLTWSNRYAYLSIGVKIVNLVLVIWILIPALQALQHGIGERQDLPESFSGTMSAMMIGGAIGGVLVSFAYPVLSLVLLNRKRTKAWFEAMRVRRTKDDSRLPEL